MDLALSRAIRRLPNAQLGQILLSKKINSFGSDASKPAAIILGIETSCDDTGVAIVDTNGKILGEALHSQHVTHLK